MTLTEFLLARIAEDEHLLELQRDGQASAEEAGYWSWPMGDALKRHERECESKRRIVAINGWAAQSDDLADDFEMGHAWGQSLSTLEALALPYANHPEYDEAWRP